jgi:uncharacterized membrane protein
MASEGFTGEPAKIGRIAAVDVARGLALLGMVVYHLTWDLAHFGFIAPSAPFAPSMRLLSHLVAGAFLALVGVSLALAHPSGLRRGPFARRLALVAVAAALVTIASEYLDPAEPITFGILHCIAVASLLAAPFVRAPIWTVFAASAALLAAPLFIASPRLDAPTLIWLGLGDTAPPTLDWRPLTPWAGVVVVGLALARLALPRVAGSRLALWRPKAIVGRAFGFAGRHSLAIYLVHQPILFAILFALANLTGVAARQERDAYLNACRPICVENGGGLAPCAKACTCVADRAEAAGLSLDAARGGGGGDQRERLRAIVDACGSEAQ